MMEILLYLYKRITSIYISTKLIKKNNLQYEQRRLLYKKKMGKLGGKIALFTDGSTGIGFAIESEGEGEYMMDPWKDYLLSFHLFTKFHPFDVQEYPNSIRFI